MGQHWARQHEGRNHRHLRSIDIRHTPRYLAGYEWRFNRRFDLPKNLERLVRFAVTVAPRPHRQIAAVRQEKAAETPG